MNGDEPTTPLDGMPSSEQPTLQRRQETRSTTAVSLAPGMLLGGRYRIVALLGRGGMGEVYRADDLRLRQPVALKFVDLGHDVRSLEFLYNEVRTARQVSHPNVCRVHDVVEADGFRFIAMEYVDGEDLASLLRRIGRLPAGKACDVARDVASGLAAAHDQGIVHRDLKPANVMLDGTGRGHITDFGLASNAGSELARIAGTPAYMAPEQIRGERATTQSDVYAFGLLLYELFTGERIHKTNSFEDRQSSPSVRVHSISQVSKDVDPAIDRLVRACLEADPALRPRSGRQVLEMLPGGDPLDAAMAAGETPSPEMIAAAAETGELRPAVAVSLVIAVVLALATSVWGSRDALFNLMKKAPEVMVDRAAEIAAIADPRAEVADHSYHYTFDREMRNSQAFSLPRERLRALRPGILRFVYRQSPSSLVSKELVQVANNIFIFTSGRVTLSDPELDVAGSAVVILDQNAALIEYRALPSGDARPGWEPLLAATGVDLSSLKSERPSAIPPVATDSTLAWSARYPGQDDRVRIEAGSLSGRPAWLEVRGSWNSVPRFAAEKPPNWLASVVQVFLTLTLTGIAVALTLRNFRQGRSDRRGAVRLGVYVAAVLFLSWLIAAHHVPDPEAETRLLSNGLYHAIGSGLGAWLMYVALEPGVRRVWPRALIGWTRLLAGRFSDPMVAREIFVGLVVGVIAVECARLPEKVREVATGVPRHVIQVNKLEPLNTFIGNLLISHVGAILITIGTMFLFFLLRRMIGFRGAIGAYLLIVAGLSVVAPVQGIFMMFLLGVLARSGLLTGAAMGVTAFLLWSAPLTLDTRAWFWPRSAAILMIIIGVTVWAARSAVRPVRVS